MHIKYLLLSGLFLIILTQFYSCDKEECVIVNDEIKPCDTSNIDKSIAFDTVWRKPLTISDLYNLTFCDENMAFISLMNLADHL